MGLLGAYAYITPRLPDIDTLRDVHLQVPLRVYDKTGGLIAEFGEMKRTPLKYEEFPPTMIRAVLAAEDDRFFEHPGVDYQGIIRAAVNLVLTGEKGQGGSTITMQVARNFFLSREKTYLRKLNEIFLALKIEGELTKEEILSLYLNKIYLGKRSYGVSAAAQVYYGKELANLSLDEVAMIAGLPKAPSSYNPIANPQRALQRRNYVLGRMLDLKFISQEEYQAALAVPVHAQQHGQSIDLDAPYIAEMVRNEMVARYGDDIYTGGYEVHTTVDPERQKAANHALREALLEYDRRHGYRGHVGHVDLFSATAAATGDEEQPLPAGEADLLDLLKDVPAPGNLTPALVLEVDEQSAYALTRDNRLTWIPWENLNWAREYIDENHMGPELKTAADVLQRGDIIYVTPASDSCSWLAQVPQVSGALVSLNPDTGAIEALSGGFDYFSSKFNRVTQAQRQPGSNFKPFIYSAAIDKGFTAASIINDAPVVFDAPGLEDTWRPENYSGRFYGPTRLRVALINSRNLVSIRLLREIGIGYALRYLERFGFDSSSLPRDLSLALGSGVLTPMELARGYTVFANGGYLIKPNLIALVRDADQNIIYLDHSPRICAECLKQDEEGKTEEASKDTADQEQTAKESAPQEEADWVPSFTREDVSPTEWAQVMQGPQQPAIAPRVLTPQTTFLMNSMMRDVVKHGTGRGALVLGRDDLAGKTGTTNDQRDAWFSGFNRNVVTTAWVGFDTPQPLGNHETGARAALPMWIKYMREALQGQPEARLEQPPGIVSVLIDPETGDLAATGSPNAIFEYFLEDQIPEKRATTPQDGNGDNPYNDNTITRDLF
ncbi:MAG: penicillin-binding protein 1A [Thiohalophilus sp.]